VLLKLLFLFIAVPLVELGLLLYLADLTDWRLTLGLVIVTGLVGTLLARREGFRTYRVIRQELAAGRLPGESMLDAVLIFFAGALLLTPGILTDAFGFTLLIPWFRAHFTVLSHPPDRGAPFTDGPDVIDSHVADRGSEPGEPKQH
jgi:UPF0716 protein FxsA